MRPRILSMLLLSLLLPLAGCGGGAEQAADHQGADSTERPAAPPDQNQGDGGRRAAKAHVTLTGPLTFDADVALGCGVLAEKGLEFTFDQTGTRAPQVQVRVGDYAGEGEYPATVVIREHPESGPVREWNGVAQINIQSRAGGRAKKRTVFNGNFNGTYAGEGGKGTVAGSFRRCSLKELLAP